MRIYWRQTVEFAMLFVEIKDPQIVWRSLPMQSWGEHEMDRYPPI